MSYTYDWGSEGVMYFLCLTVLEGRITKQVPSASSEVV